MKSTTVGHVGKRKAQSWDQSWTSTRPIGSVILNIDEESQARLLIMSLKEWKSRSVNVIRFWKHSKVLCGNLSYCLLALYPPVPLPRLSRFIQSQAPSGTIHCSLTPKPWRIMPGFASSNYCYWSTVDRRAPSSPGRTWNAFPVYHQSSRGIYHRLWPKTPIESHHFVPESSPCYPTGSFITLMFDCILHKYNHPGTRSHD